MEKQLGFGEQLTQPLQGTKREFRALSRQQRRPQGAFGHFTLAGLHKARGVEHMLFVVRERETARTVNSHWSPSEANGGRHQLIHRKSRIVSTGGVHCFA
jgi:hypothetical protein